MRSVGLKVLKNKLSEYVRHAAGGETVLITDRDRVVAELVPPQPGRSPLLADARLAEAVREGWLAPPLLAGSNPPPRKPVMTLRELMQDLQQDREDRLSISIARSPWRIYSRKIAFRLQICGSSNWYQAVCSNTRCGTGFM